ncbi:hypothetical protein V6N13_043784 [Hibiscus sabdariffa]
MLQSEGFKVKVSIWPGYYMIIQFEEEEQLDIFWDLKDSLLKPWLCEIESVENFMQVKKLPGEPCASGMQEMAPKFSENEANFWQAQDTHNRRGAGESSVPCDILDNDNVWQKEGLSNIPLLSNMIPRRAGPSEEVGELAGSIHYRKSNPERHTEERCLLEVPIHSASYSYHSQGHNASIEPIYDSSTGLFTIKPKMVKCLNNENQLKFRSKFDKIQNWAAINSMLRKNSKKIRGRKKTLEQSWDARGKFLKEIKDPAEIKLNKGRSKMSADGDSLVEARASFEVCENLGLVFYADEEVVMEKFREIEERIEN